MSSVIQFLSHHPSKFYFACNFMQSMITTEENRDPSFLKTTNRVQYLFDACIFVNFLWSAAQVIKIVATKASLYSYITACNSCFIIPAALFTTLVCFTSAGKIASVLQCYFPSRNHFSASREGITVQNELEPSSNDELIQTFNVMQIAASVSLIFLSSSPLFFSLNAFLQVYCLVGSMKRNFLAVSATFDQIGRNEDQGPQNWILTYLFQRNLLENQDDCAICLSNNPTFYFCQYHSFHEECISRYFYSNIDTMIKNIVFQRRVYETSFARYQIQYPTQNILKCPICRQPPQEEIRIKTTDIQDEIRRTYRTHLEIRTI